MEPVHPTVPERQPEPQPTSFAQQLWPDVPAPAPRPEPAPRPRPSRDEGDGDHRRQSFYRRRVAPVGAALLALLAKLKFVLLFLGKFKLLVTAGSMAVSVAAYTTIWGFPFAVGFVVLLLVHEYGHVIALRREGIKASAPMFIPFLGAVITSKSLGENALAEARVGLAGPILGSIGAGVCLLLWKLTGHTFWQALGFTGLFLNLFNLLPVVPLDGGRAMAAMSPWMWIAGFAGMIALAIAFPNPIIIIIAVFAALETYKRLKQLRHGGLRQDAYYRVSPRNRAIVGAVYLGLIVLLVVGMNATHLHRVF
jgi:Zn-dependent protease